MENKKKQNKSTSVAVAQRVERVIHKLIAGQNRSDIVQFGTDTWQVGERQIDKYIAEAKNIIRDEIKRDIKLEYAQAIKRFEFLFAQALTRNDLRLAVFINKEIAQLQGLYKTQIEHSGEIKFISGIPD